MPITVTAPAGQLTPTGETEILPQLTAAFLEATGGAGNAFLTSIVGGHVSIVEPGRVYGGGVNRPLVTVELRMPNVAIADPETKAAFIESATAIVEALTIPGHRAEDTWVNILHAQDGSWGLGGRAYTGDALLAAASESALTSSAA
jgi:phenylpyruvate tautomerase PptA (4-oxalocrotonate tautomerase family)